MDAPDRARQVRGCIPAADPEQFFNTGMAVLGARRRKARWMDAVFRGPERSPREKLEIAVEDYVKLEVYVIEDQD